MSTIERQRPRGLLRDRRTWLAGVPALIAIAYLIAMLLNFHSIITGINMDSDVAVAPVMAKLLGQAPANSHVILGNHPYYEEFVFMRATAGLPFYRQLWEVAPMVWTLLGFGVLAWTVRRVFGALDAVAVATALVCFGGFGRFSFFSLDWHGVTVFHTIVVAATLVWFAPRAAEIGWPALIGLSVALGLFNALPTASDVLFPVWALLPAIVAASVTAWRGSGRARVTLPAFAVLSAVVAGLAGAVVGHVLRSDGIGPSSFALSFAQVPNLISNFELLLQGWMTLGGGNFFGLHLQFYSYVVMIAGLLVLAGLGFGLARARQALRTGGESQAHDGFGDTTVLYVTFWTTSIVLQALAFVGSSAPVDTASSRYVLAGYVAIAALIPLVSGHRPRWRWGVTAGVCVFALSQTYQLIRQPVDPANTFPNPAQAAQLSRFADAHGVRYGYAGYWDAADLTWLTHFHVQVFPVINGKCGTIGICPFPSVQINTWYVARPGVRSMLIADPSQPGLAAIAPGLGAPLATAHIGPMTAAVYPFDIASRL